MNFKEYSEVSKKTLCYDSIEKKIACCAMEIAGELSEYLEMADVPNSPDVELQKELGDLCYSIGILSDFFQIDVGVLKDPFRYNPNVQRFFTVPNLADDGFHCVCKLQEVIKKVIRDDNWILKDPKKELYVELYLSSLYTYIVKECEFMGWNLSDILLMNVEKLQDRMIRGRMSGDGNSR